MLFIRPTLLFDTIFEIHGSTVNYSDYLVKVIIHVFCDLQIKNNLKPDHTASTKFVQIGQNAGSKDVH